MGIWQALERFSPQIVKSHSCITSGARRCHGGVAYLLSEANTMVMLLVSSSLWLAKLQMELAPKQLDEIEVAELDKAVCLSNWSRAGKSISGFQGCVNKALCATIGEQNRANSLCFVHCFFLAGGEGSIAKTPGGNTEKLNCALLRRQDFKFEDRSSISISNKSF